MTSGSPQGEEGGGSVGTHGSPHSKKSATSHVTFSKKVEFDQTNAHKVKLPHEKVSKKGLDAKFLVDIFPSIQFRLSD